MANAFTGNRLGRLVSMDGTNWLIACGSTCWLAPTCCGLERSRLLRATRKSDRQDLRAFFFTPRMFHHSALC